jgi:Leucine-rich repeat (LRR) protein
MAAIAERAHGDPLEAEFLNLSKMNLSELPDLSSCERLKRLDLSCNSLSSAEGISGCRGITWLSLKDNQVGTLPMMRDIVDRVLSL